MKRRLVTVVIVLTLAMTASVFASDEPYDGAHFKRVTFVVADLERSLQIYRDILGFQPGAPMESSAESYSYPVFNIDPDAKVRFMTLDGGPEQVRTLALVEVKGMDLPKPGAPFMTATVIRVDDLDATFAKLEELGLETVAGTVAERPGEFKFNERAFVDFDGHLVVLYQMLPLE